MKSSAISTEKIYNFQIHMSLRYLYTIDLIFRVHSVENYEGIMTSGERFEDHEKRHQRLMVTFHDMKAINKPWIFARSGKRFLNVFQRDDAAEFQHRSRRRLGREILKARAQRG